MSILGAVLGACGLLLCLACGSTGAGEVSSSFGHYDRTRSPYTGAARSSAYVTARDGVRLAVDIYRPTINGQLATDRLPVVWTFLPYLRSTVDADGTVRPNSDTEFDIVHQGYIVAVADVRGTGASFGARRAMGDSTEANDGYDITEWLATQPWSNGAVGMMGCSYFGMTALRTATVTPPHLKAVFVGTTIFDQYTGFAGGGIIEGSLYDQTLPKEYLRTVAPVESDRSALEGALKDHENDTNMGAFWAQAPYRDSISPITGDAWWVSSSIYPYLDRIAKGGTPIYVYGGLYDEHSLSGLYTFANLRSPRWFTFGPWHHCESPGFDLNAERLRFVGHFLKSEPSTIDSEPHVHVYATGAPDGSEWRALQGWPPADAGRRRFYLAGPKGVTPVGTENERGHLASQPPAGDQAADAGFSARADIRPLIIYGSPRAGLDQSSLTYTLPVFDQRAEVAGIPVADLWVSSKTTDADIHVYLEHVNAYGGSTVISTGVLRASMRAEGRAPYDTLGAPWQRYFAEDKAPLVPGIPVHLRIAMKPTSYVFRRGDLLRLAISNRPAFVAPSASDASSVAVMPESVAPEISIFRDARHASFIDVPFADLSAFSINGR